MLAMLDMLEMLEMRVLLFAQCRMSVVGAVVAEAERVGVRGAAGVGGARALYHINTATPQTEGGGSWGYTHRRVHGRKGRRDAKAGTSIAHVVRCHMHRKVEGRGQDEAAAAEAVEVGRCTLWGAGGERDPLVTLALALFFTPTSLLLVRARVCVCVCVCVCVRVCVCGVRVAM